MWNPKRKQKDERLFLFIVIHAMSGIVVKLYAQGTGYIL